MAVMRSRQRDWTAFGEWAGPLRLESWRRTGPAGWVAGAAAAAGGRRCRLGRGAVAALGAAAARAAAGAGPDGWRRRRR